MVSARWELAFIPLDRLDKHERQERNGLGISIHPS